MAGTGSAQDQLNEIVSIIAGDMVAEVCSVYVRRAGDVLELFATQGLKSSAVHLTRLRVGEGLIGDIAAHARPLALSDAQAHPGFAYRPETGEEIYHSLMGVPIWRRGRVGGVLAVQNRTRRQYAEEEVETLETVAMVVAELIFSGQLVNRDELRPTDGIALLPLRLGGVRLNSGIALGTAVLHQRALRIDSVVAEDPEAELVRLRRAVTEMHGAIDDMLRTSDLDPAGEHAEILETYRMIAADSGWLSRIEEAVNDGLTAEAAVQKVHNDIRTRMSQVSDPYLRERVHDFEDLANRLMQHLMGVAEKASDRDLPDDMILVAKSMGPAELFDYDHVKLRGLVLEEGSATSHVAIVARALDIPIVGNVPGVLDTVEEGDVIIIDGNNAQVFVRPGEDVQQTYNVSKRAHEARKAALATLRDQPAVTRDGQRVQLQINAGMLYDLQLLDEYGADGVGLYRTEVPFMVRSEYPDVETQHRIYARVFESVGDRPVIFRTLDVGGDKGLPYWDQMREENPAMGWRAIRVSLDRPAMLRQQLRALILAAQGRPLRIMFPMVAEVPEFIAARRLVDRELARAESRGTPLPGELHVGVMLEVPALALQLPYLLRHADFISVGSNDLLQFLYASDRSNPMSSDRYDTLAPATLRFLNMLARQCDAAGVPFGLCGEMGGRTLDAMALVGLGYRSISVAPPAVGPVKAMIRSLSAGVLRDYLPSLLDTSDHSVRQKLRAFAQDHGVLI
ncbi:MAG: phosphoenolpyruvate--protein phosphotransferase [Hyphomicrobiales bacterium]|nr:phosphoenolpyruvate--protein phosphotransferase [Hyphomicrobiales bacterium]MCP5370682.1 phosphoenolpyruvate--protein phosphotransferase [Hyphomicrobiales bacterium]